MELERIEPARPARGCVIWLHGLGADGHDFLPAVPALQLPDGLALRFLFPHAPIRPVTVNGGLPMRAWYDIRSMGASREVDRDQLAASGAEVAALIDAQVAEGIPSDHILLIGFSQGGAVAYHTALRYGAPLAGLAALSTYRIGAGEAGFEPHPANLGLPLWIAHGEWDGVVPPALGRAAYDSLVAEGRRPLWHSYPMDHEVCVAQLRQLGQWMAGRFAG